MNYIKIYNNIIDRAKKRVLSNDDYIEEHHILPRSLGGKDEQFNLVNLIGREHCLVHLLLIRIYPGVRQLIRAAHIMYQTRSCRKYEASRKLIVELHRKAMRGQGNPIYGKQRSIETRRKISESNLGHISPMKGKHHKLESIEKMKESKRGKHNPFYGRHLTDEHKEKLRIVKLGFKHTEESKRKISLSTKGKTGYWKGKTLSIETRIKMRLNHADFSGDKNPFYKKNHTEESKKKISETKKGQNEYS